MDVRVDYSPIAGRADAPTRVGLGSADLADRAAGDGVRLVDERVLVSCFDVQDVFFERAHDALELRKKRLLVDVLNMERCALSDARHVELDEQQARFAG